MRDAYIVDFNNHFKATWDSSCCLLRLNSLSADMPKEKMSSLHHSTQMALEGMQFLYTAQRGINA